MFQFDSDDGAIHVVEASGVIVRYKVMSNLKIYCCAGWRKGITKPSSHISHRNGLIHVIRGQGRGTRMAVCAYASVAASELGSPL